MGYANCIAMLKNRIERPVFVDGSLYGMGKSAGNAPLELIAMHLNERYQKNYKIGQLLEAIDANISQFYQPATWGYNMFYYLAASNDCHPNYVANLMEKRTLSVNAINTILRSLEEEKKLMFDKNYIEKLYIEYQDKTVNDKEDRKKLAEVFRGKTLLILGPGSTLSTQKEAIDAFLAEHDPTILSVNFIPDRYKPDFVFLSNSKRYVQLATKLSKEKYTIIATSNITSTDSQPFDYQLNYSTLIDREADIVDNSLIMLLKTLIDIGIRKVYLAGCDGYSEVKSNYCVQEMEYDFIKNKAKYLNEYTIDFLKKNPIEVVFLTDSFYRVSK